MKGGRMPRKWPFSLADGDPRVRDTHETRARQVLATYQPRAGFGSNITWAYGCRLRRVARQCGTCRTSAPYALRVPPILGLMDLLTRFLLSDRCTTGYETNGQSADATRVGCRSGVKPGLGVAPAANPRRTYAAKAARGRGGWRRRWLRCGSTRSAWRRRCAGGLSPSSR